METEQKILKSVYGGSQHQVFQHALLCGSGMCGMGIEPALRKRSEVNIKFFIRKSLLFRTRYQVYMNR
jgi:hypothetical protein